MLGRARSRVGGGLVAVVPEHAGGAPWRVGGRAAVDSPAGRPHPPSGRATAGRRRRVVAVAEHVACDGAVLRIQLHVLFLSDLAVPVSAAYLSTCRRCRAGLLASAPLLAGGASGTGSAAGSSTRSTARGRWRVSRQVPADCRLRASLPAVLLGSLAVSDSPLPSVLCLSVAMFGVGHDAAAVMGVLHRHRPRKRRRGGGHDEHGRATSGRS